MLDLLITNAEIVDGTGAQAFHGAVGVKDGKIVLVQRESDSAAGSASGNVSDSAATAAETATASSLPEAAETVDAAGLTLTPGFIDSHSHNDRSVGLDPTEYALCKISQGVTTEVTGQCGSSNFPVSPARIKEAENLFAPEMPQEKLSEALRNRDFGTFLSYADQAPKAINYAFLMGHGTLRAAVMGTEDRKPTPAEMDEMKAYLTEAMEHGCMGLSTGLIYVPGVYADTEEIIELCRVMKPYGGIYATHMRSESDHVVEAVAEAIRIAEEAGVPLFISHHKICGPRNWGASKETLRLVHEAIGRGVKITMDQYPYLASQTGLVQCMPPEYRAGGDAAFAERLKDPAFRAKVKQEMTEVPPHYNSSLQNAGGFGGILVLYSSNVPEAVGKTLEEYAKDLGKDPFEAYFDLMIANNMAGMGAFFCMQEEDMQRIYLDENTVVCTDNVPGTGAVTHPRSYGALVRAIHHFSTELGLVSFEEAVRKETSSTADRWGLTGKGRIAEGYDADLTLLDRKILADRADFLHPTRLASGIEKVYVNGVLSFEGGRILPSYPGKCITRKGAR